MSLIKFNNPFVIDFYFILPRMGVYGKGAPSLIIPQSWKNLDFSLNKKLQFFNIKYLKVKILFVNKNKILISLFDA